MIQISVIIPTYKPADYLFKCLQSLNNQTLDSDCWEVICVLNGCDEPYKSRILEFASSNLPQLRLYCLKKGDVSTARNYGIEKAKGQYIVFLDDDDYISSNYLEETLSLSADNRIVITNAISFIDENMSGQKEIMSLSNKYYGSVINSFNLSKLRKAFETPWMKLFPKNMIGDIRFIENLKNGEDTIFNFAITANIKSIAFTSKDCIYFRRIRDNSAFTSLNLSKTLKSSSATIIHCSKIYFKNPSRYSLSLYLYRILGAIKSVMLQLF